jgi:chorismate synthase
VAKIFLECFEVSLGSWVTQIGSSATPVLKGSAKQLSAQAKKSDVLCPDEKSAERMRSSITKAKRAGDTLGGLCTIAAWGLIPGLGSHVQWDRRLDMRIAGALMSIQAIKGVEFGDAFAAATRSGSCVHDSITYRVGAENGGFGRASNNAGGVEGGISTGEPIVVQMAMKPIATLKKPLPSIEMKSKQRLVAGYERSDVCAVPAAAVVGEAMLAIALVTAWQEKFGGDSLSEIQSNWKTYQKYLKKR